MLNGVQPARLTRSRRVGLLAVALLVSVVSVAGCSGSSGSPAMPASATSARGGVVVSDCLLPPVSCTAPHALRVAYGIQPLLDRGADGRGETVTIVAPVPGAHAPAGTPAGGNPPAATDIRQDLAAFDSMFRLPAVRVQIVTTLAGAASRWRASGEEAGDLEKLHTVAPAATLRVVLLPANVLDSAANATADMLAALRLAVSGTDVASISWSIGEHFFTRTQVAEMHSMLLAAAAHGVTVIGSSGDQGGFSDTRFGSTPVKEVSLPASDPLVLGVGGTTLSTNPSTGAYLSETAWQGSGGGFSHLYARPAYQDGVSGISAMRGVPDVASDAQGSTPLTLASDGKIWIISAAGTSGSAPLWGGLIALAAQYAHHDLGSVNPAIYRIATGPGYHKAFHDVTAGGNDMTAGSVTAGYRAGPGWDPVTGWGSPDAQVLIPLLARS
jgi:subtilase family serine protease